MAMQCSLQSNPDRDSEAFELAADLLEPQTVIDSPYWGATECHPKLPVIRPSCVYLNLEDLKCFEVVEQQFHCYGIAFKNAIALQPSNPAYPPRSGTTVLMGAPKNGWLEVIFSQPVCMFCCYITSSQRAVMSVFDTQDKLLTRYSMIQPNLAGSDSEIPANTQLKIEQPNVSRITLYAFDGQLTISDLSFSF